MRVVDVAGAIVGCPCLEAGSFLSAFWKFRTADSSSFLLYTVAPILVPYAIFQAGRCRALHRYTRTAHEIIRHSAPVHPYTRTVHPSPCPTQSYRHTTGHPRPCLALLISLTDCSKCTGVPVHGRRIMTPEAGTGAAALTWPLGARPRP